MIEIDFSGIRTPLPHSHSNLSANASSLTQRPSLNASTFDQYHLSVRVNGLTKQVVRSLRSSAINYLL